MQCHDDLRDQVDAEKIITPPALADVRASRGCLADRPTGTPDYHLDDDQRAAIESALAGMRGPDGATIGGDDWIDHQLATWNCYACHARDGRGGVQDARDPWFTSKGHDLGDEGRIPPDLTGVGDRLTRGWLSDVLERGNPVRPYLATRMPRFGVANTAGLADALIAADAVPAKTRPRVRDRPELARDAGRLLVGEDGFACITCHDFNRRKAPTMEVLDLVHTTDRLRYDWFARYLVDPEAFHPGTRMPSFWPRGASLRDDVLGGNTERQLKAIWTYLEDGPRARDPVGLDRKGRELVVGGDAIVYRGKLWEAGFRGIAVGHPEGLHLAFDAEATRLALLWKERFLDASAHWNVQGMGRVRPLGRDVIVLPKGPPFVELQDAPAPWPTEVDRSDHRFRGYDVDERGYPTFRYEFRGVTIEEASRPAEGTMRRAIRFAAKESPLTIEMLAARGKRVDRDGKSHRIDDRWTISAAGADVTTFQNDDGTTDVRCSIRIDEDPTTVTLEYRW